MEGAKPSANGGYTLLELAVSLSVSLTALGLIFSLVMMLGGVITKSRQQNELIFELTQLEREISSFYYENNNGSAAVSCENNRLSFSDSNGEKSMRFYDASLDVNGKSIRCTKVIDISFEYNTQQKCLKVSMQYKSSQSLCRYDFLLCGRGRA